MKIIKKYDLEIDTTKGKFLGDPAVIYLKSGKKIEHAIDGYTYDDEPFCNYIEIGKEEIPFDEIEKVEILD